MRVVDIANEIYLENSSPTDTSIAAIAFWVRACIGELNNKTYENFYIDPTTLEIFTQNAEEIGILAVSIIKAMYRVYRVNLDIRKMMMAIQADSILEATDQDFSIKKINKSEVLKTLSSLRDGAEKELYNAIHCYRSYNGAPQSVDGDDTQQGYYASSTDGYVRSFSL